MRHLFIIIIALLSLSSVSYAQSGKLGDEWYNRYNQAFDVYEKETPYGMYDYISAYTSFKSLRADLLKYMSQNAMKPETMDRDDLINLYFPIQKSYAELSYYLGLNDNIQEIIEQLSATLEHYPITVDGNTDYEAVSLHAKYQKICGDNDILCRRYASAEKYLLQSILVRKLNAVDVSDIRDLWMTQVELADVYYEQKKYIKALARLDSALVTIRSAAERKTVVTSRQIANIKIQRAMCLARLGQYADAKKQINSISASFPSCRTISREYAECLRAKAKILMLQYDATGKYDDEACRCYERYFTLSKRYASEYFTRMSESEREQYWMAERPFVTDCYRLTSHAPSLLYNVTLYSRAILLQLGRMYKPNLSVSQRKAAMASLAVTWKDVQARLKSHECAIEFLQYEKNSEDCLGALVLTKAMKQPVFVDICSVKTLYDLNYEDGRSFSDVLLSPNGEDKDSLYTDTRLQSIIWAPAMIKAIGNCKSVFFSPDGILHQLSVEYLLPQQLSTKKFWRITSTRSLTDPPREIDVNTKALFCGGVDFNCSDILSHHVYNDAVAYGIMAKEIGGLAYLAGTKYEVDSILEKRNNNNDKVLYDIQATEDTLKILMPQYQLIHIATHGYFAEQDKRTTELLPARSDAQLSKSCIFLAGVMHNLQDNEFDASSLSDGILSARELAKLDLSHADVVILSACLSGVGTLTPDGVYGLQRGLKAAGVNAMIVSLWKVDDAMTVTLMKLLYENMHSGMNLHDAFYAAREELRSAVFEKKYLRRGRKCLTVSKSYNRPQYYDAFVLIDAR